MSKNRRKVIENILLFPVAFLLLVAGVEFAIIFGGTIWGPFTINDWPELIFSPVFHGLATIIVFSMFVPWGKIKDRFQI